MARRKRHRNKGASLGQDLDLSRAEAPSASVDRAGQRLDEFRARLGNQDLQGEMHIRVKGELHRGAEYLLLCAAASSGAGVTAAICHLAGARSWLTVALALAVGAVVLSVGRRHVAALRPGRARRPRLTTRRARRK